MWIRRIELTIKNSKTQAILLQTHEHRIDFSYQGTLTWISDKMKVDVYNLGTAEVRSLIDASKDGREILFRVGYEDDPSSMATLMDGIVVNANGMKQLPHHITSLWCVPKWATNLDEVHALKDYSTGQNDLKTVIEQITTLAGFSTAPTFVGIPADVLDDIVPGRVFNGDIRDVLESLGDEFGFYARNAGDGLAIISTLNSVKSLGAISTNPQSKTHRLKVNLVKGTPQAEPCVISIPYNLDANIRCGDILDVEDFVKNATINAEGTGIENQVGGPSVSGIIQVNDPQGKLYRTDSLWQQTILTKYQLQQVNHFGSNFTSAWQSTLLGNVYSDGLAGDPKSKWDEDIQNKVQGTEVPSMNASLHNIFDTKFKESENLSQVEANRLNAVQISPAQQESIIREAGGNYQKAQSLANVLKIENYGQPEPQNAVSPKDASGPWQMMPKTAKALGVKDTSNFDEGARGASRLYDEAKVRWKGDRGQIYADYNAGATIAGQTHPKETRNYVRMGKAMEEQQNGGT